MSDSNTNSTAERRGAERVAYPINFLVAEYDGSQIPNSSQLKPVRGRDISTTGIAFFSTEPLDVGALVAILSSADALIAATARVMQRQKAGTWDGRDQYLVGCEFVDRISTKRT